MPKFSDEAVAVAVAQAYSFAEAARLLNAGRSGSSQVWVKRRVLALRLDYSHFYTKRRGPSPRRKTAADVLVVVPPEAGRTDRLLLLRAMLERGVLYRCADDRCPNPEPSWAGRDLPLEIDHVDGDWRNNRLENLRFLCPNCHSLTETNCRGAVITASTLDELEVAAYARHRRQSGIKCRCGRTKYKTSGCCSKCAAESVGRRREKQAKAKARITCPRCGRSKGHRSELCKGCDSVRRLGRNTKIEYPPLDELVDMVEATSYRAVARQLGVSDNAVRKYIWRRRKDVAA